MKRCLLFLLLIFFGCKTEEEIPVPSEQEEFVITSPKEVTLPEKEQTAKPQRKVTPTPVKPQAEPEAEIAEETQTPKEETAQEPNTRMNDVIFEKSFGDRSMHSVIVDPPPKHPDSLKWEDISGGPMYYSETPWWIKALGYANMVAALGYITYLLVTGK